MHDLGDPGERGSSGVHTIRGGRSRCGRGSGSGGRHVFGDGSALGSDGWGRLGAAVATGGEDSLVQCSGGAESFPSLAAPYSRSG